MKKILIPTVLLLLNFAVKIMYLSSNSIAGDEPFSIFHAQMNIEQIIEIFTGGNNPPLYEIFLHFWIQLFGISAFSVRFPSFIFSCITVLFLYKLSVKHLNQKIAIYTSILFIFSNYHILFAHESRVYALLGMFTAISMYYFLNIINAKDVDSNKKLKPNLAIFLIISILMVYSHYFGFFLLIAQLLFVLLHKKLLLKLWKPLIITIFVILLAFIPNIITFYHRMAYSTTQGTWVEAPNGFDSLYVMLWNFSNAPVVTVSVIIVLLAALAKYLIKRKQLTNYNYSVQFITFTFLFIFFFMFGISYLFPMFLDRYLMPASIAFSLLVAIALDYIIRIRKYEFILPVIVCGMFVFTASPNATNKRNLKEAIAKIKEIENEETIIFISPNWYDLNFMYHYNRNCFANYAQKDSCMNRQNIYAINHKNLIDSTVYKKFTKVIFFDANSMAAFPDNGILEELKSHYKLKEKHFFYEIFNIYEFEKL